jgi:hypothetical protein
MPVKLTLGKIARATATSRGDMPPTGESYR